jgi:hypothetical protein
MSCSIRVLTNVDEWMEWSKETLSDPEARKKAVEEIRESFRINLEEEYPGEIWYVRECMPDVSLDSDELIFGFERPEKICKTVENWNLKSTKNCINQMKKMEDQARDKGFQTLSAYLESAINDDGNISGVSLYSLRKALDAADDMLSAESPYLAQIQYKDIKSGYSYDYKGVRLDPEAKAYILEHPEEYVLIEIDYD